jgi:CubicO group peptidase (beta-lactamase class C family)
MRQGFRVLFLLGMIAAVAIAGPASQRPVGKAELIPALKAELAARTADDRFSGAVLIASQGWPLFHAAYGWADRERGIPNRLNTRLRFGSLGKMFTGVAVMQLVQAGKVRLDDPLRNYLPDYPNTDVAAVTIHQLLTHSAGTGDVFGPEFDSHRLQLKSLRDYVALYGNRGLRFPAGSRFDYSNYGYILLGRVIEEVSGESYTTYVRNHIFRPAGMLSTDNLPEDQFVRDRAIAYTAMSDPGQPPAQVPLHSAAGLLPYRGTSAGGGYSTVGDLLRFANALDNYRLLQPYYTDLMLTGKVTTTKPGTQYAYGFEDSRTPDGVRFVGHGGGGPGQNAVISIFPDSGRTVIVLANLDPPAADEIERFVRVRLPQE